jgi:hypothetical protein
MIVHKEKARKNRKLGELRCTVKRLRKQLDLIECVVDRLWFLLEMKQELIEKGATEEDAQWVMIYVTEAEEL